MLITILTAGCICFISRISGGKRKPPFNPEGVLTKDTLSNARVKLFKKGHFAKSADKSSEQIKHMANLLSGVTTTLTGTMTSYWFSAKFGASPGWIGIVMGISYIAAGLLSLTKVAGEDKRETVLSVIAMQLIAIVLLLALPWMTSFWLAAVLEIGCTACNLGTRGNRTAMMMDERGKGKRTGFSKLNHFIIRAGAVLWPGAYGKFIEESEYFAPFYIIAALQAGTVFLYAKVYRRPVQHDNEH